MKYSLEKAGYLLERLLHRITSYFDALPLIVRMTILILLCLAVVGIGLSHGLSIYSNRREWKSKTNSTLKFSYFCGTGQLQRKKTYQDAHIMLRDRKWSWISFAGLAFRLGNFKHPSKILTFACTLIYIPLAVLGFVEMALRIAIGTLWLLGTGLIHRMALFVLQSISYLLIPVWQTADKSARFEQHCPHCYNTFDLPGFICPHCGVIHKQLVPSRCGILTARCECNRFVSSSTFTGRSQLRAVCPKCDGALWTANAKHFSIQLIGGNASGKTAFLAAFQHIYIDQSLSMKNLSIYGEPLSEFEELEKMFQRGNTESTSPTTAPIFHLIHKIGRTPKHNLAIFDIPSEFIISGVYERNPLYYGYSDGIIIMIDPLSLASVREACKKGGDDKAIENYSQDDIDALITRFIHQFSEITGRSSRKMIDTPVAVVISKADVKVIKKEIGLPKIKAKFNANPNAYVKGQEQARNEICREYLDNLGLANALNNLESTFAHVNYFPISAIGHLNKGGKPFEPFGIIEPIAWIARNAQAGIYKVLINAQGGSLQ
jgi:GTPase SAR1 family protein